MEKQKLITDTFVILNLLAILITTLWTTVSQKKYSKSAFKEMKNMCSSIKEIL